MRLPTPHVYSGGINTITIKVSFGKKRSDAADSGAQEPPDLVCSLAVGGARVKPSVHPLSSGSSSLVYRPLSALILQFGGLVVVPRPHLLHLKCGQLFIVEAARFAGAAPAGAHVGLRVPVRISRGYL